MPKKREETGGQIPEYGQAQGRKAEHMQATYSKMALARALREAEYKESLGMELTPQDRFILDNKAYFEKLLRRKRK